MHLFVLVCAKLIKICVCIFLSPMILEAPNSPFVSELGEEQTQQKQKVATWPTGGSVGRMAPAHQPSRASEGNEN